MTELTAEQEEIRSLARRFADEKIAPHAADWDRVMRSPPSCSASWASSG